MAAPLPPPGAPPELIIDTLRTQLTQRANELLEAQGEAQELSKRVAALKAALDDSEKSGRDAAAMGAKLAKEREAFLQEELTKRDEELARTKESLAVATERVMEVQRESEAAIKAKNAQIAALKSKMDDITDKFNEDLQELKRRLESRLGQLSVEVDEGQKLAGHDQAGGVHVAGGGANGGLMAMIDKFSNK